MKGLYNEYQLKLDLSAGYAGREPKFSQAQKAAAIEHYFTHGRCIAATMRALSYPWRGTRTKWLRKALPEVRKAVVGSVGQRRYPESLKQRGVMELHPAGKCAGGGRQARRVPANVVQLEEQLQGREAPTSMKPTNQSPQARESEELERQVEMLRREVRQLRLEQDFSNKASELLKKGLGVDLQLLSNRERTRLIDALKEHYDSPELCHGPMK